MISIDFPDIAICTSPGFCAFPDGMPIDIEVKFVNGEKVREHWDGQARWTRLGYQKKSRVESVEIDPDHKIHIDRDNFNNSFVREPNSKPTQKISNYWLFVTQWFSQAMAWWAV